MVNPTWDWRETSCGSSPGLLCQELGAPASHAGSPVASDRGPFLLPGDHCTRLYELEGVLPAWPESGQPGPEDAIGRVETRAVDSLLVDGHLVLEGENL